ncbi:GAPES1 domain-containing protein [Escherichia coli]
MPIALYRAESRLLLLYDKYQNQSIAAHVMRALAAEQSECRQNSGAPSARLLSLPREPMA